MPFIGSRWVPGPGEPQQAPQRVGSRVVNAQVPGVQGAQPTPPPAPGAPPQPFDREAFKNEWMGGGNTSNADRDAFIGRYGLTADQSGRVRLPTGELIDMTLGAKAGGQGATWTGVAGQGLKHGQAAGPPRGTNPSAPAAGAPPPVAGTLPEPVGATAPSSQATGQWDELYKTLLERSTQGLAGDRNNPVIRAQADAYGANEERAKRNYLNDLAEKQGPLANLGGETRLAAERVGQRTGDFEAELMGRELEATRDEIQQALTQRGAMLTEAERQNLQMKLAQMNDAIQRYQIQTQDSQFGRQLAQSGSQFDRGLAQSGSQYDRSLAQGESQFGRTRADSTTERNNYWDSVRSGLL